MAQIIPIVSDALQATIRRLLPSQNGFGEDLQAQNVIVPIIDLTPSAEGSVLPSELQSALNFGGNTSYSANNSSAGITAATGFWRISGTSSVNASSAGTRGNEIRVSDGLSTKTVYEHQCKNTGDRGSTSVSFDFVVFLSAGDSMLIHSNGGEAIIHASVRQVADVSGNLVNPVGFTSE